MQLAAEANEVLHMLGRLMAEHQQSPEGPTTVRELNGSVRVVVRNRRVGPIFDRFLRLK